MTVVPWLNWSVQIPPQLMPELIPSGDDTTVPIPAPFLLTVTAKGAGDARVKVAVTFAVVESAQAPMPVQPPPLHPENIDPAVGVAVSVAVAPPVN